MKEKSAQPHTTTSSLENKIQSIKTGGSPLPEPTRAFFEPRFGYDFSQVRVHTDGEANRASGALNAQAFTVGHDIFFSEGRYPPNSLSGRQLLAHELTHTIQQGAVIPNAPVVVRQGPTVTRQGMVPKKSDRDADFLGHLSAARAVTTPASSLSIQRRPDRRRAPRGGFIGRRFRNCDDDQNFFLDFALMRVPQWVNYTISELESLPGSHGTITVAESTLNRFFHPPSGRSGRLATIGGRHTQMTINTIVRNLRRMLRVLQNPRLFRCAPNARGMCSGAYAYAGPRHPVVVCPNFFEEGELSLTEQLSTLIHEVAHRIDLMRNVIDRDAVMALPLYRAMNNAESYALLVIETFHGPPRPPAPAPVAPLTTSWSPAHMASVMELTEPVRSRFIEGQGQRRWLSSVQSRFTPPVRFQGRVRYYLDTEDVPIPSGTPIPSVRVQMLFSSGFPVSASHTDALYQASDDHPLYDAPGVPLNPTFNQNFDFTVTDNGRLRITLWMGEVELYAFYDDRVYLQPELEIPID